VSVALLQCLPIPFNADCCVVRAQANEEIAQTQDQEPRDSTSDTKILKIGILAPRSIDETTERWQPTADYLTAQIPGYKFEIVPLDIKQIDSAIADNRVDYVLTNPGMYIDFEADYGATRIATLKQLIDGKPYTVFGGVILRRADRDDIKTLADLRGKVAAGLDPSSLGAWNMQMLELKNVGIDPPEQAFRKTIFTDSQDNIVLAVRDRKADVGMVRAGLLEEMATEGTINLDEFAIINPKKIENFPFLLSTDLYPEWPFAAMPDTPENLSTAVATALLQMPEDSAAAKAAQSGGWTVPLNYQPVNDLLLDLEIGPYAELQKLTFEELVQRYWYLFAIAFAAFSGLAAITIYLQNRSLTQKKRDEAELQRLNKLLKENADRQRQQREAQEQEIVQLMQEVEPAAEGNLTVRAQMAAGDVGIVADLFNVVIENLQEIAIQVRQSAGEVSESLVDNEDSIRLLTDKVIAEAKDIRQTLNSIALMSRSIEAVASSAGQAAAISDDTFSALQEGNTYLDKTVWSIQNLRTTVGETAKKIKLLGESAQQISQVVTFIEDIARQTRLLSINANIEAGRAGEWGYGFRSIAEQVGELADEASAATQSIAQMAAGIQAETQAVVQAIEIGTTQVVDSTHFVDATKQGVQAALQKSQSINELMRSISQTTISQTETSQLVTDLMQQLAASSEQLSESSNHVAAAIHATAEVAQQLKGSVEQFQV
jgi:twitching motility protein PilJ